MIVTFWIEGLLEAELTGLMERGVMDGLEIFRDETGTDLIFEPAYGVHGHIKARQVSITFEPGQPASR